MLLCNLHYSRLPSCKLHNSQLLSCYLHDSLLLFWKLPDRKLLSWKFNDSKLLSCKFHDNKLLSCKSHNKILLSSKLDSRRLVPWKLHHRNSYLPNCTIGNRCKRRKRLSNWAIGICYVWNCRIGKDYYCKLLNIIFMRWFIDGTFMYIYFSMLEKPFF